MFANHSVTMKKLLALLIFIITISFTFAQTQQGIVKTRGRVVNGQVVAGQRLTGATITLSIGNPQVSQAQGTFSFNVPDGKSFSLVSAKKQGYTLADPEYTRRTFKYSAGNPFYVVLEDEAQRQADIKEATDKVRKTLKRELRKREDELDELRESNAITQAKYDSLRMEFATYRQSSEALVNEMSQRFAAIDYDQLDEFNRQVQLYIEEGELLKADSLINTRGSLEERYARVKEQESVNTQREEEIRQQQESLAKSQELTQREKEDLMSDLYAKHTIYLQAYQQDSALYCLKMRADLDTTNAHAIYNYLSLGQTVKGETFLRDYEKYCHICLRQFMRINDLRMVAWTYIRLSSFYEQTNNYEKYKSCCLHALKIMQDLFEESLPETRKELAIMHQNVSIIYKKIKDYENSVKHQKEALKHYSYLNEQTNGSYIFSYAESLVILGELYSEMGDYLNSEKYLMQSIELLDANKEAYRRELASTQNKLGKLYARKGDYPNSEKWFMQSLEHYEYLFKIPAKELDESLKRAFRSIGIYVDSMSVGDRKGLPITLLNLGKMYTEAQNYDKAEYYLSYFNKLYQQSPQEFSSYVEESQSIYALLYESKGENLLLQDRKDEALEMWKKVQELNPNFLDNYPDGTNLSNGLKKLGLIE